MFCSVKRGFPPGKMSLLINLFFGIRSRLRDPGEERKKTALVFGKEKAFVLSVVYLLQSPIYLIFVQWEFSSYAFG